jgi:hypothetical protein
MNHWFLSWCNPSSYVWAPWLKATRVHIQKDKTRCHIQIYWKILSMEINPLFTPKHVWQVYCLKFSALYIFFPIPHSTLRKSMSMNEYVYFLDVFWLTSGKYKIPSSTSIQWYIQYMHPGHCGKGGEAWVLNYTHKYICLSLLTLLVIVLSYM